MYIAIVSQTGKLENERAFCQHGDQVEAICISPDDRFLLTAGIDKRVRVWDFETGIQNTVLRHEDGVVCLSFSANGHLLLSGCADNLAYIWLTKHWEQGSGDEELSPAGKLTGHAAEVVSVEFSRDRVRALTASKDGTAKLWDLTKFLQPMMYGSDEENQVSLNQPSDRDAADRFREVMTLSQDNEELVSANFSNHGRDIVTTSRDGQAVIWRGSRIPASIGLSKRYLDIDAEQAQVPVVLDGQALVLCPSDCNFDKKTMAIEIFRAETINEKDSSVDLQSDSDPSDKTHIGRLGLSSHLDTNLNRGSVQRDGEDLYYLPLDGSARERLGAINNSETRMEIEFTKNANVDRIEQLIRAVTLSYDGD